MARGIGGGGVSEEEPIQQVVFYTANLRNARWKPWHAWQTRRIPRMP